MKKTVSVTLGGIVFNVEEDAYQKLDAYLTAIRAHFAGEQTAQEIVADIEASMAEKFSGRVGKRKQAITAQDAEEVITVMGQVSEIVSDETPAAEEKRGSAPERTETPKRLYRNPDDAIVAGVASGLAAYFGIDPVFMRLAFVVLTFVNGFGILAYLILWLVVPRAETSAQKLEMVGKPVNLSGIQEAVKQKGKALGVEGREALNRLKDNRSELYRILNFPIRLIARVFELIRRILGALGPVVSITIGVAFLIGVAAAVIGLSTATGMLLFQVNSPYIISDVPLHELSGNPWYHIFVIALYVAVMVPVLFLGILGTTLVARKNTFRPVVVGILTAMWFMAVAVGGVAAADVVPFAYTRTQELMAEHSVTRSYDHRDFTKLYLSGRFDMTVTQGNEFSISLTGSEEDLDGVSFAIEEGQLQITQSRKRDFGVCFICLDHPLHGQITMPRLDSFVGIGSTVSDVSGFSDDVYVSLGETASADMALQNQNVSGSLSGVHSMLTLTGEAQTVQLRMDGFARLTTKDLKTGSFALEQTTLSRSTLAGSTDMLEVTLNDSARLDAFRFEAKDAKVTTGDATKAYLWATNSLNATAGGDSRIIYKPETGLAVTEQLLNEGEIEAGTSRN